MSVLHDLLVELDEKISKLRNTNKDEVTLEEVDKIKESVKAVQNFLQKEEDEPTGHNYPKRTRIAQSQSREISNDDCVYSFKKNTDSSKKETKFTISSISFGVLNGEILCTLKTAMGERLPLTMLRNCNNYLELHGLIKNMIDTINCSNLSITTDFFDQLFEKFYKTEYSSSIMFSSFVLRIDLNRSSIELSPENLAKLLDTARDIRENFIEPYAINLIERYEDEEITLEKLLSATILNLTLGDSPFTNFNFYIKHFKILKGIVESIENKVARESKSEETTNEEIESRSNETLDTSQVPENGIVEGAQASNLQFPASCHEK